MLAVTGTVIASGTPCPQAKAPPANSAGWKSTRKLAQQAPQDWQGEAEACWVMDSASTEIDHDTMQVVTGGEVFLFEGRHRLANRLANRLPRFAVSRPAGGLRDG